MGRRPGRFVQNRHWVDDSVVQQGCILPRILSFLEYISRSLKSTHIKPNANIDLHLQQLLFLSLHAIKQSPHGEKISSPRQEPSYKATEGRPTRTKYLRERSRRSSQGERRNLRRPGADGPDGLGKACQHVHAALRPRLIIIAGYIMIYT